MASSRPALLSPEEQQTQLWNQLLSHNNNKSNNNNNDSKQEKEGKGGGDNTSDGCPMKSTTSNREWPSYDAVISHVATADYKQNISCPHDILPTKTKLICPHGAICCVKMELFDFPAAHSSSVPYSGLLTPGTTHNHCLLRMSTAIRPLDQGITASWARAIMKTTVGHKLRKAKLVPGAALKVFRSGGIPSGNLLLLGSKVGQREEDYFAHCQSTQMTEKMPAVALPFVKKFWQYSQYPLSLGLSDFCGHDHEGKSAGANLNFPYSIVFQPLINGIDYKTTKANNKHDAEDDADGQEQQQQKPSETTSTAETATTTTKKKIFGSKKKSDKKPNFQTFDSFLDEVTHIPIGTPLFDIYAIPDPKAVGDPTRIERIGRLTTTSAIIQSAPTDGISFRHQIKEEDFLFKPEWIHDDDDDDSTTKKKNKVKIKINDNNTTIHRKIMHGNIKGTVGKLAGWRLYEEDIALHQYIDYEKQT